MLFFYFVFLCLFVYVVWFYFICLRFGVVYVSGCFIACFNSVDLMILSSGVLVVLGFELWF